MFQSARDLHEASARVQDVGAVLENVVQIMKDDKATKTRKKNALKDLEKVVTPAQSIIADVLLKAAHLVAPLPQTGYLHKRMETDRGRKRLLE